MKKITVFTPTYNRAYILPQCYNSLKNQSSKNFIWLIIDDGSTDGTYEIIKKWQKENIIEIHYIYQKNSGKQIATNTAIMNTKTDLFAFLDSDDFYEQKTVENFINLFKKIENNPKVSGILARRGTVKREIIGNQFLPRKEFICNYDKLVKKYNFFGDTCRAYKTKIIKNYLYPEIKEKFILESVMFSKIDLKYDLLVVNEIFSISEYLIDGYTKNSQKLYRNNPIGYMLGINQLTVAKRGIMRKIKAIIAYIVWSKKNNLSNMFCNCNNKLMFIIFYPISIIFYRLKIPKLFFEEIDEEKND